MGVLAILMLLAFPSHLAVVHSVTMPTPLTCVSNVPCSGLKAPLMAATRQRKTQDHLKNSQ